ncbi:MAG: peptidase M17, partial [Desulfobacterales bacterium]|nr:peptidase M17 [Desulfobacterales bacterium]
MKKDRITTTNKAADTFKTDLLVYLAVEVKKKMPLCPKAVKPQVKKAFDLKDFQGKAGEQLAFYPPAKATAKRVMVLGLGALNNEDDLSQVLDDLREAGGRLAKAAAKAKTKEMVIVLPDAKHLSPGVTLPAAAEALAEGVILGDYRFTKYKEKTRKKTDYPGLSGVRFVCNEALNAVRAGVSRGKSAAFAACSARDMANEPGNGWTSADFAAWAEALAKDTGLTYRCIEKKEMETLGMGGILAVNQGSAVPPRLVVLEYRPESATETILLVGKGLTFDSGGISIKPAAGMEEMKYDMCGGAAVLSAMAAVAEEKPDVAVVAVVPATDNMSGSNA